MPSQWQDDGEGSEKLRNLRRRQILSSLGAAGALGLAGCAGGGDGDDEDTPTPDGENGGTTADGTTADGTTADGEVPHVSGQEFVMPMEENPEEVTFYAGYDEARWLEGGTDLLPSFIDRAITHPRGFITNWDGYSDQTQIYRTDPLEEVRWMEAKLVTGDDVVGDDHIPADKAIQYEITEDIPRWSDGTELTATDFLPQQIYSRMEGSAPYDKFLTEEWKPQDSWAEIGFPDGRDGKIVQFTDPWGAIEAMGGWRNYLWFHLWRGGNVDGGISPSHLEPFKTGNEKGLELIDRLAEAVANDESTDFMPGRGGYTLEYTGLTMDIIENRADPENAVVYGPWQPVQKEGAQAIRYEPNPEWGGPAPNFDAVRLTFAPEAQASQRITAAFQSGEYDFLTYNFEQSVQQGAPDKYEKYEVTSDHVYGVAFNGTHKDFGRRDVRAAIYYAIDSEALARLIDPGLTSPYSMPGTEMRGMDMLEDTLSDEWINNNLIDYSYDPDRADQLMQDEGYSREGGTWVNPDDGDKLAFDFPTTASDTSFQETIVDMLGDWGIELNLRTLDEATMEEAMDNGQYHIWSDLMNQTWPWVQHPRQVWYLMAESKNDVRVWRQYPEEVRQQAFEITGDNDFITPEADDLFKIQIPPVGEPDGDLQDFRAVDPEGDADEGPLVENLFQQKELMRKFYWAYNWWLPQLPVLATNDLWWFNTANWDWSPTTNHFLWTEADLGTSYPGAFYSISQGDWVLANPDDPKEGASVDN